MIAIAAWLFYPILAYLVLVSGYLFVVTLASFVHVRRVQPDAPPLRIAMLIPAHDEVDLIGDAVANVLKLDYPRERYTVFVIADNCSDATAERAAEAGAEVIVRTDATRLGKHYALDWVLHEHAATLLEYDAISVTDADTEVHSQFLREISSSLARPGVKAVQGYYGVSNFDANWRTAMTYIGFAVINHIRTAGRRALGGTAGVKGNGIAFESKTFVDFGFPAFSLVEDLEFSVRLLIAGIVVHYNPRAIVNAQMPAGAAAADKQRSRWEGGRFQTGAVILPLLMRQFIRQPRWRYIEAILDYLTPPFSALVLLELIALAIAAFLGAAHLYVVLACLAALAFCVFSALVQVGAPARIWLSLVAAPIFLAWKAFLYARLAVTRRDHTWRRTPRE